jgi:hypothetical protein
MPSNRNMFDIQPPPPQRAVRLFTEEQQREDYYKGCRKILGTKKGNAHADAFEAMIDALDTSIFQRMRKGKVS